MTNLDLFYRYEVFSKALRIRMIEQEIAKRYPEQEMRCPVHLSIGQEANAVAIAASLTDEDFMVSTHRGHAHYLAKGGRLDGLLGELYGRSSGCSRGNGGSMHLVDRSCGFLGSTSIVGGTIPIGVGAAFAAKLQKKKNLTAVCIGDAAIEEGVFHESANFAALHQLPVIFFVENNNYSCFTPRQNRQPERVQGFKSVAESHGLKFLKISWENFYEDFRTLQVAIKALRESNPVVPLFVECDAYRFVEHCGPHDDDHLAYRPATEVLRAKSQDPIGSLSGFLRGSGFMDNETLRKLEGKIQLEINEAIERVRNAPRPSPLELGDYLYAEA